MKNYFFLPFRYNTFEKIAVWIVYIKNISSLTLQALYSKRLGSKPTISIFSESSKVSNI